MTKRKKQKAAPQVAEDDDQDHKPDWSGECEVCGATPIHPLTGMCGPCSFGEADTIGGNW